MASWLRIAIAVAIITGVGCDAILGIDDGVPREAGGPGDSSVDAASDGGLDASDAGAPDVAAPNCDVDAAFATPTVFTTLDGPGNDEHLRLVPNELTAVYQSVLDGGLGSFDIYTAARSSIADTWKNVTAVPAVNSASADDDPSISADQLTLYLARGGGIYRATRATATRAFAAPAALAGVNSGANDFGPYLGDDGSALYFSSTRDSDAGVAQLFVTQPLADGGFTPPTGVAGAGTSGDNRFAAVTADQLVLYFGSTRSGGQGSHDVWLATRASTATAFGAPRIVPEVSSTSEDQPTWVSSDRCRLYLTSNRSGTYKLYVATKTP